jgi:rhamnopyranosyl-N-acetylglucosaminyl-diphospho-decaprenol beta-1,3/1,4-galactofuranosyltransferase
MKKTAVVIVTYNNAPLLEQLLSDVCAQTYPVTRIIVVDNASKDGTQVMVGEKFPNVQYIKLPVNSGSAGGYYEGLKAALADNDYIWTLDDDGGLFPDTLDNLVRGLESLDVSLNVAAARDTGANHPHSVPTTLEFAPWKGTLFRADVLKKIGLPEKEYFIYGEDIEYSLRLHRNGYSIYWIPSSKAFERRQEKSRGMLLGREVQTYPDAFRLYYAFRNQVQIYIRYRLYKRCFRMLLYGAKILAFLLFVNKTAVFKKCCAVVFGIADGLRNRLGPNARFMPG